MQRNKNLIFAPSILSADFSEIGKSIQIIESAESDWIHLDVMDGSFVPNITFGHKMVQDIRRHTALPLDVHLMTMHPETFIDDFSAAGADYITFHFEAAVHSHRIIQSIKNSGCKAGVSIVPSTPVSFISELLPFVDLILVMSVNPGFGGQSMIPETLEKVRELASIRKREDYSYLLSVDGGINRNTSKAVIDAGTDVLISGSAFFNAENPSYEAELIRGDKEV